MEEQGPFDRILQPEQHEGRDRAAMVIVAVSIVLGLLLLILVLPPVSILDDGGGGGVSGPVTTEAGGDLPAPPPGFEALSPLLEVTAEDPVGPADRPRLTVSLSAPVTEGEPLVFFTFQNEEWRRLGDAVAVADGESAQGEVPLLPDNVAVFRQVDQAGGVVYGRLPAGEQIDPRATGVLSMLNPAGLSPAPDGGVDGGPLELPEDLALPVAPKIRAGSPEQIDALNAILSSPELRDAHVAAILDLVRERDFAGIDLDYRVIDAANGDAFVDLVSALSEELHAEGRTLTLVLPLPVRQGEAWDTLGFDWEALAPLVDHITLPADVEPDQYYTRVEDALGFLVPAAGSGKLVLTISPLSRERSVDGVRTLTLTEALSLASAPTTDAGSPVATGATSQALGQNLAGETGGLQWDEAAQAVVFRYTGEGGDRTVWLANLFSEAFKLDLAQRFQLGGIAIEDVSERSADANIWPAVASYAESGTIELVTPNASMLQPAWTASGGELESSDGVAVTWHAPEEAGTYTLTLVVSDGVIRVGQELEVSVQPAQGALAP